MKNEPKVSVVIPFYSGVAWLEEAVESVLNQTYSNLEIFVVNDGSKEDVSGFLAKYGDKINYVLQTNAGPGAARNNAIRRATGKYIAFLDSDDMWTPDKLELQIELMERTGAMWSHTNYKTFFDGTTDYHIRDTSQFCGDLTGIALVSAAVTTSCVIIKKEYFDLNPNTMFGEHMRYGQDAYLFTQICWDYPLEHLAEYGTLFRKRNGEKGVSAGARARVRFRVRRQMWDFIKQDTKKYKLDKNINGFVKFTYGYYSFWDKCFTKLEGDGGIRGKRYELTSKFLLVPIYAMEKIYKKNYFRKK